MFSIIIHLFPSYVKKKMTGLSEGYLYILSLQYIISLLKEPDCFADNYMRGEHI